MEKLNDVTYTNEHGIIVTRKPESDEIVKKINEIIEYISPQEWKNQGFMYLVILVDKFEDAAELNAFLRYLSNNNFKAEAFNTLQVLHGLQHNGKRPTHVIDAIKDRSHPNFNDWYNHCVLPTASKGVLIGGKINEG